MRIFECTDSLLPLVDGVGRVVVNYCDILSRHGHEVYAICPMRDTGNRGDLTYEIVDFATTVGLPKTPQYQAGVASIDPHYLKRIDMICPDIVHVHSPASAGLEGIRLARKYNVPLVGTFHSKYYDDMYAMTKSRTIAHLGASIVAEFFECCDEVWTVSEYAARELESYGYKGEIRIVKNGTNPNFAEPCQTEQVKAFLDIKNEPMFLYVGQIDRKKNIELTLKACALLHAQGENFRMVFVGQGRDLERFQNQAQNLGISEHVIFTGHVSDQSLLAGIYRNARLFVFPSAYDTAGLVVSEAGAMGTPSVALFQSAPAEIICDGENGLLCDESPESLADVMKRVLHDQAMTKRLGEAARITLPRSWESVISEAELHYERLIQSGAQPRHSALQRLREKIHHLSEK